MNFHVDFIAYPSKKESLFSRNTSRILGSNFIPRSDRKIVIISFLPRAGGVYKLAPYEEINKEQYEKLSERVKDVDFSKLITYEKGDTTKGAKELACVSGTCEI